MTLTIKERKIAGLPLFEEVNLFDADFDAIMYVTDQDIGEQEDRDFTKAIYKLLGFDSPSKKQVFYTNKDSDPDAYKKLGNLTKDFTKVTISAPQGERLWINKDKTVVKIDNDMGLGAYWSNKFVPK